MSLPLRTRVVAAFLAVFVVLAAGLALVSAPVGSAVARGELPSCELIVNGSFEQPVITPGTLSGTTPTGWSGNAGIESGDPTGFGGAFDGVQVARPGIAISQPIPTAGLDGQTLIVTLAYRLEGGGPITVQLGEASQNLGGTRFAWSTGRLAYTMPTSAPTAVTLTLTAPSQASVDAVSVVSRTCGNTAPILPDGATRSITTSEDTAAPFTVMATDADGDALTYTPSTPTNGTVTPASNETGSFTYTPAEDANGPDSFTVVVSDGIADVTLTVNVTVTSGNDAPVIDDATTQDRTVESTGRAGATVDFTVTATDIDSDTVTVTCVPASGSTFAVGTTTVTCTADDGDGATDTATFDVRVVDSSGPEIVWVGGPQPNTTYSQAALPAAPTCTSTDPGDLVQCRVFGYSTAPGRYTLTARARDTAGNASVSTRSYTVTASAPTSTPRPTNTVRPTSTPVVPTATAPVVPTATTPVVPTATTPPRPPRPTSTPVIPPTATPVPPTTIPTTIPNTPTVQPTGTPTRPPRR